MYSDLIFRAMKRENLSSIENLYELFGQDFINDILLSIGDNLKSNSSVMLTSIEQIPDINGTLHNMSDVEAYKDMQSGLDWRAERKEEVLEGYRADMAFLLKLTESPPKNQRQKFLNNISNMSMVAGNHTATRVETENGLEQKLHKPKTIANEDNEERQ